jgi:hypothetical protein
METLRRRIGGDRAATGETVRNVAWLFISLDGVAESPDQCQLADNFENMLAAVVDSGLRRATSLYQ